MSEEKARIDSHKLMLHPERVADWLNHKTIYPINLEICIIGACNHRCTFCCCDYMEHKPDKISLPVLQNLFNELQPKGLKSILLAGSGEPLLHTDFAEIVTSAKKIGIDVAVSTNGVLFTPQNIEKCLGDISWVRFSVSAGTEENYLRIHRGKPGDLARVFDNISRAAELKAKHNYKTVLNVQIVMIPDNVDEIVLLAEKVKSCGADRYIVKSYGDNFLMQNDIKKDVDKDFFAHNDDLKNALMKLNDDNFQVVYRKNRIDSEFSRRNYNYCHASSFHACICADGSVCPCANLQGIPKYSFGNINESSFSELWESKKRLDVMEKISNGKMSVCPTACKLDSMNRYLHELLHPDMHVNFI